MHSRRSRVNDTRAIGQAWRRAWEHMVPLFAFPPAIRKMIYTTNAVESLNRSLRKIIKTRGSFPTNEAALKLLFLAIRNAGLHWRPPIEWLLGACAAQILRCPRRDRLAHRQRSARSNRPALRGREDHQPITARPATAAAPARVKADALADATVRQLSRKSERARAFRYRRARWAALARCFDERITPVPVPLPAAAALPQSLR